jgi:tetratricopeptide (TPR) repeat protein
MLRGFWRVASLAILLGLGLSLVACGQVGKLQAKRAFKDGNVQFSQQEYKKAIVLYEEAIAADPEVQYAHFFLANSYDNLYKPSRKGEKENDAYLEKAIQYYRKAADIEKDAIYKKRAMQFLVNAYGPDKMNDPTQAEPLMRQMIQLDPQDSEMYFGLAKIYEDAGEYEKAAEVYAQAKQARPNDPLVYVQTAAFYNRQEEFDKTIDNMTQRAALEPKNPEAYYTIATYYWDKAYRDFRLKDPEKKDFVMKGIEQVDKALALKPDYNEALTYKNLLLRLQANLEKDPAKQQSLIKEADKLRDQALDIRKQKTSGIIK